VRAVFFGAFLAFAVSLTILSLRPGGIRRQLRLVARRFRIVLVLLGLYAFGSLFIRLVFPSGPVADWGPPVMATVMAVVFVVVGQDPRESP
jgi:hypothetical protein